MRGLVLVAGPGIGVEKENGPSPSRRPVCLGWPEPVEGPAPLSNRSTGPAPNDDASHLVATVSTKTVRRAPRVLYSRTIADVARTVKWMPHACQVREALLGLTYAQLEEPLLQIVIGDFSLGRREFIQACEGCAGVPATFGEAERPAVYRWYGLFGISSGFGGGFEAVAMRESGTSQLVRIRRWLQLMQLEWRPAGETVAHAPAEEEDERGEVILWGWTWAASHRRRHGIWTDA